MAASATQLTLTLQYSEAMRTGLACGTSGAAAGPPGAIDGRADGVSPYHSADGAYDETLQTATRATISPDCTTVTFVYGAVAPPGRFTVTVSDVRDVAGNAIDPERARVTVTVEDLGRPSALAVDAYDDSIYLTFSEPMLKIGEGSGVTMAANYYLNGSPAPITTISCGDQGCRSVRLWLRGGSLSFARSYTLLIANVVDRAGLNISPDPTTLTFTVRAGR